jgi:hypothetical protein
MKLYSTLGLLYFPQILEFVLPIAFIAILVAIKSAIDGSGDGTSDTVSAKLPRNSKAITPLSFGDYVTAMRATRECVKGDDGDLWISGIDDKGSNWQVPFVKCDSRECDNVGEDAQKFCQYAILAVSPSSSGDDGGLERAEEFRDWIYTRYPDLNDTSEMPFDFDFVKVFSSPDKMSDYVKSSDYGEKGSPKIAMGVVWDGNSATNYRYRLRQNSTNFNAPEEAGRPVSQTTPDTDREFDSSAKSEDDVCGTQGGSPDQGPYSDSCTGQYLYNGVLTFQRLIGDFILEDTGAKEAGYYVSEAGVQYVEFPTKEYEDSGFFESVGRTFSICAFVL